MIVRGRDKRDYILHYQRIYHMAIHAVMEALLNGDKQFANKAKAVWLQTITEAKEKGIDVALYSMPDFTGCDEAIQLTEWKLANNVVLNHYADRIYVANQERLMSLEGDKLTDYRIRHEDDVIEGGTALDAITEGQKEGGTTHRRGKRSSLISKVIEPKIKIKKKGGKK